jgi:predicted membrane chloride channel (bestrophin family)
MQERKTQTAPQASPEQAEGPVLSAASIRLFCFFPWHLRAFLAVNVALNVGNAFTGRPWWAFWPLAVTSFALAIHYLFYKAAAVDDRWVEARAEELNLKSYDRSHIEDLKTRLGAGSPSGKRRADQGTDVN